METVTCKKCKCIFHVQPSSRPWTECRPCRTAASKKSRELREKHAAIEYYRAPSTYYKSDSYVVGWDGKRNKALIRMYKDWALSDNRLGIKTLLDEEKTFKYCLKTYNKYRKDDGLTPRIKTEQNEISIR
jgi:hypothetical protein